MTLKADPIPPIPAETVRVAHAAFPHGSLPMRLRDSLEVVFTDDQFTDLYSARGQPAAAPWRLALVTILQFAEELTDAQAAVAVRGRIDWKYSLSLPLTDAGFDSSVLSEFRTRLVQQEAEQRLFDLLLDTLRVHGWLDQHRQQRTDSTHVLTSVRVLNRLELVGETLRQALNALAEADPDWLRAQITDDWYDRYSRRIEDYHLPKGQAARAAYAQVIGQDGWHLLHAVAHQDALCQMPAVVTLRRVWEQQYLVEHEQLRWRKAEELPPSGERIASPYDGEARFGNKRSVAWTGYKVHLTETCADAAPHLITHVETTQAMVSDVTMTKPIQQALVDKRLAPQEHIVDAGYTDAQLLLHSEEHQGIHLIGPVRPNPSWQARRHTGYSAQDFTINWDKQEATCPQGKVSSSWADHPDAWGNEMIAIRFAVMDCRRCPVRALCTRSKAGVRHLTVPKQEHTQALAQMRAHHASAAGKQEYDRRAGIEGTLSQGIRAFGLRQARYAGLPKVRLAHWLTAAAINCVRLDAWQQGQPLATTRRSRFAALKYAC